jgi:hypothetical protein
MRVKNTTDGTYATVLAVDSNTQLSLNEDIMVSGDDFVIYSATGSTVWINKQRITDSYEAEQLATLLVDAGGADLRSVKLNTGLIAVQTAMLEKDGDLSYAVASYTAAPNTIVLATAVGDVESKFIAGEVFTVYGEGTSNDSIYSVVSASFAAGQTTITVTETPTAATAYGGLVWLQVEGSSSSTTSYDPGVAETGVTAVHTSGDGKHFVTTLSFTALATPGIAGAAAEATGVKLYTFPAGVHVHQATDISVALQGGGVVDADTPEVGIGSVIGSGANATLGAVGATSEDYILGQVAADVNGTATEVLLAATAGALSGISLNQAADVKAIFLNFADTWAGADTVDATGYVSFNWTIVD